MCFRQLFVLFLLGSISWLACKKERMPQIKCSDPTNDIRIAQSLVVGDWLWAYEKYRDRFTQTIITKTPQTEGLTRRYTFQKDGLVTIYKNDSLLRREIYEITTLNIVTGSDMDKGKTILLFKNQQTAQRTDFAPLLICNDTLTLNYQAYSDIKGQETWHKK